MFPSLFNSSCYPACSFSLQLSSFTIGPVSQIAGVFRRLILEARKHLREGSTVERSAQAVSIGIFWVLFVPFWLVQLPFSLIGSLWSSHRMGALATTAVLLSIIYAITLYSPYLI